MSNNTRYTEPVAEAVVPERSFLSRFWWLLPLLALLIALPFILRGCNRTETPAAPVVPPPTSPAGTAEPAPAPAPVESECSVEVPCEISIRWWGNDERQRLQLEAIQIFEEQNPDIRVLPTPTNTTGHYDALAVEMVAGNPPDLFTLDGAWPMDFGADGGLYDLRQLPGLDLTPYSDEVLGAARSATGQIWGLPTGGNTVVIWANPALFEQAGVAMPDDNTWSWDDFQRIGQEISDNTPDGTFGIGGVIPITLRAWANQRDGGMYSPDGQIMVSEQTLTDFFEMTRANLAAGATPPAAVQAQHPSDTAGGDSAQWQIALGNAAMSAGLSNQMPISPVGVDLVPLRMPGDFTSPHIGTWLNPTMFWSVSNWTRYPEATGRLLNFLVNSPDAARILVANRGAPFNQDMLDIVKEYVADRTPIDFVERIAESPGRAMTLPVGSGEEIGITDRMNQAVLFGQMTPQQAAQQWLVDMQAALDGAPVSG